MPVPRRDSRQSNWSARPSRGNTWVRPRGPRSAPMPIRPPTARLIPQLRRSALAADPSHTDGQLLAEFVRCSDPVAFAALVRRHGPMVLGVCRRVVGDSHLADDAFQAVFLVLARRAAAVRPRERVGNWLYGVAYRTAVRARAGRARRRAREEQVAPMTEP